MEQFDKKTRGCRWQRIKKALSLLSLTPILTHVARPVNMLGAGSFMYSSAKCQKKMDLQFFGEHFTTVLCLYCTTQTHTHTHTHTHTYTHMHHRQGRTRTPSPDSRSNDALGPEGFP
jgi:hypothetical protein